MQPNQVYNPGIALLHTSINMNKNCSITKAWVAKHQTSIFCLALIFFCRIVKGENMIWGGQLGQFHVMCITYMPPKCVAFRFHF